jgi:hypothetical protein
MADKYWTGEIGECDICGHRFWDIMYDAHIIVDGGKTWANVCQECFDDFGFGLGQGLGQRYAKQVDGRWLKTGG